MYLILWVVATLLVSSYVGQPVVKFSECPGDCDCELKAGVTFMTCTSWLNEHNMSDMHVLHFELTNAKDSFKISSSAFDNIALTHVNSITIFNSSILTIDKSAFSTLSELSSVKIAYSNVSQLHPKTFASNSILRQLNLTGNPLKLDPFLVSNSIEEMDLSHCNIDDLGPNTFANLSQLILLDLSNNNIKQVNDKTFSKLVDIQEIRLAHNDIKELTNNVFVANAKLEVLDLSHNPLLELPAFDLSDLQVLKVHACKLENIRDGTFDGVEYLTNLDLSKNVITGIDRNAFHPLKELTSINLAGNRLRAELHLENNTKLEKIILDDNTELNDYLVGSFKDISKYFSIHYFSCNNCGLLSMPFEVFQTMSTVATLLLSHNKLSDISTGVFKYLPHLVVLDLSYNHIHTISDNVFVRNIHLNKISLQGNPLGSMHSTIFRNNTKLEYLDISQCGLYELWTLPSGPLQLNSLLGLNASANKFKIVDRSEVAVAPNLKVLDISNNPLLCTNELRMLIEYLQEHGVTNGDYRTHESQMDVQDFKLANTTAWKEIAQASCPTDDVEDEDEFDSMYDEDDSTIDYVVQEAVPSTNANMKKVRNLYIWPILVFFSTFLLVVAFVVNTVLFIIQKRQSLARQNINIKTISRLKKNSGFVYQQLSEEHKQQNPIFSKFNLVASAHKSNI